MRNVFIVVRLDSPLPGHTEHTSPYGVVTWLPEVYDDLEDAKAKCENVKRDDSDKSALIVVRWAPDDGCRVCHAHGCKLHCVLFCYMNERRSDEVTLHAMYVWREDYANRLQEELRLLGLYHGTAQVAKT